MTDIRVLIVDDEEDICEILKFNLEKEMYKVDTAYSAEEALQLNLSAYQLILLDVMMGEMSGFQLANILRKDEKTASTPIIFLTARDTENDILTGFSLNADDYISKPFTIRQVMARVKAVLRRSGYLKEYEPVVPPKIAYGSLVLNPARIKASIDEEDINLTKKEYLILELLLKNQGKVFSREEILSRIWGIDAYVSDRVIDVTITRLRKKIGPYEKNIVARQGFGYCFEA